MKPSEPTQTFESMLAELETIIQALEDGAISLDDALARYEKGVGLLKCCHEKLKNAEQKIQQLTGVGEGGQPIVEQFSPDDEISTTRRNKKKPSGSNPA